MWKMSDEQLKSLDLDVNEVLDTLIKVSNDLLDGKDTEYRHCALALAGDLAALDYLMRNGHTPTAWRK